MDNKEINDLEDNFLNSDKKRQLFELRFGEDDRLFSKYKDYILQNFLSDLANIVFFDDKNLYFWDKIPEEIQSEIILKNLELFDTLQDNRKIKIINKLKNKEDADYLIQYYSLYNSISFMSIGDMFDYLNSLSLDEFKKYIDMPDILNSIIFQTEDFKKMRFASDLFASKNINRLSNDKIDYLFSKLLSIEKRDIVDFYIENIDIDLKRKYSSDSLPVKIEYLKNGDTSKLEEIIQMLNNNTKEDDIIEILLLYPNIIDDNMLYEILNKIDLDKITKEVCENFFSELLLNHIKRYCLNVTIEKSRFNFTPRFLNYLSLTDDEFKIVFDKFKPEIIIKNIDCDNVYKFLLFKLKEDENYLSELDSDYLPYISEDKMEILLNYLPPKIAIKYLKKESIDMINELIEKDASLIKYINDKDILFMLAPNYIDNFTIVQLFKIFDEAISEEKWNKVFKSASLPIENTSNIKLDEIFDMIITKMHSNESDENTYDFRYSVGLFYDSLSDKQKLIFIDNALPETILNLLRRNEKDELLWDYVVQNSNKIFSTDIIYETGFFSKLRQNQVKQLIDSLDNKSLVNLFTNFNSPSIEEAIYNRFKSDVDVFCVSGSDLIFNKMKKEHQDEIVIKLAECMQSFSKSYPEIYNLIEDKNELSNFILIKLSESGMLDDTKIKERYIQLLKVNKYVNRSLNYNMLTDEYFVNNHFLDKISRYPFLEDEIINLNVENKNQFELFKKIANYISMTDNDEKIFDRKIVFIINDLKNNNYLYDHELSEQEIQNLERYILHKSAISRFSNEKSLDGDIDILNYSSSVLQICDSKYREDLDIEEKRNILFRKYFDMSKNEVEIFLKTYDNEIDSIEIESEILTFINCLKEIINFSSDELDEFYKENDTFYSVDDLFYIENAIQIAYTRDFKNKMYSNTISNSAIEINGENVPVIVPEGSFNLLIHSTNAYRKMQLINNNYYDSWNSSKSTNNHGICTALISDYSLGFTPLGKDVGCIYGFNDFSEKQFGLMAPYDLVSNSSNYSFEAIRPSRFSTLKDTIDYTRHTHNEIVLERRNLDDTDEINIQPNYVIITNEFSEMQKQNALKAAREMNDGKGLPILYIDFEKIIAEKKNEIREEIDLFRTTSDFNLLSDFINKYECIKCTKFEIEKYDFVDVSEITNVIDEYIDNNYFDSDKMKMLLHVLETENNKFEMLASDGPRQRYFDINFKKYSQIINSLNQKQINESGEKNVTR